MNEIKGTHNNNNLEQMGNHGVRLVRADVQKHLTGLVEHLPVSRLGPPVCRYRHSRIGDPKPHFQVSLWINTQSNIRNRRIKNTNHHRHNKINNFK